MSDVLAPSRPIEVPPPVLEPSTPDSARKAERELEGYTARNLDAEGKALEFDRSQNLKGHVHRAAAVGVWFAFILGMIAVVIFVWHELAPGRLHWLDAGQIGTLRTFLFSSAATSVVGTYMKQRV